MYVCVYVYFFFFLQNLCLFIILLGFCVLLKCKLIEVRDLVCLFLDILGLSSALHIVRTQWTLPE